LMGINRGSWIRRTSGYSSSATASRRAGYRSGDQPRPSILLRWRTPYWVQTSHDNPSCHKAAFAALLHHDV
jgi:hypothetical protein